MTRCLHIGLASLVLVGCGEETFEDGLPGRPEAGTWISIAPGGDTICSRGTPYNFFVRGGDSERIIIDFQGGGACWDAFTCGVADSLFSDNAGTLDSFLGAIDQGTIGGIFDDDADYFLSDYTIIHIPYCTGDIHWGNATAEYSDALSIEHKGLINARSALDWVYSRYPDARSILVSGCSAGAYGAALHSAYIAQQYASADIAVLADSGAGIITDTFLQDSLPNWNAEAALPPFIESLQRPLSELSLTDLYIGIGQEFPNLRLAQTATQFDADQIFFFTAMGGQSQDWPGRFRDSLEAIDGELDNFTSYVPPGSMHCVTPYPFFFDREVEGVRLSDWLEELVHGDEMPAAVACEGQACCDDPVCATCTGESDDPRYCRFCSGFPPEWAGCP